MTRALLILVLIPSLTFAQAGNKDRVKQLRAEIAALKTKLAALEKELAGLEGPQLAYIGAVKPPVRPGGLPTYSLKIGDKGSFGDFAYTVTAVLSNELAIVRHGTFSFMVTKADTAGLADGAMVTMPGTWEIARTITYQGRTYYVVTPKISGKFQVK